MVQSHQIVDKKLRGGNLAMRNFNEAAEAMYANSKLNNKQEQLRWSLPSGTQLDPGTGFYHTQISNSPEFRGKV